MGNAIGQSLPFAVGIALSPIPIIASVLILATPRARINGPISGADQAIAFVVFALVGTIGVGVPAVIYFTMGTRAPEILGRLKDWMGHNNAVIMAVLCLVIGIKLIGDAISGLTI